MNDYYVVRANAYSGTTIVAQAAFTAWFNDAAAGDANHLGTNLADALVAGVGADTLQGLRGSDYISGGAGNDVLLGGDGNDWIWGDDGADSVDGGTGNDTVIGELPWQTSAADTLRGGAGNDEVSGGGGADLLFGDDGNDWIKGEYSGFSTSGPSDDTLDGGRGNDTLIADAGADSLVGGDGNDNLTSGAGADTLNGGNGADLLLGGSGNDILLAGRGADTLRGGSGADTLTAGSDSITDIFVFGAASEYGDRINGFETAHDRISLPGGAGSFGFVASGTPTAGTPNGRPWVLYETDTGILSIDVDGSGGIAPVVVAVLAGRPALTADNILFG